MKFNIIASINNHNIIGENNDLLIKSKKDLINFQKITTEVYSDGPMNIVIMGFNTWLSLPPKNRPLKNRMNIIITKKHKIDETKYIKSFPSLGDAFDWTSSHTNGKVFVIGGSQIFNECCKQEYIHNLDLLYITKFDNDYHPRNTTHSFPSKLLIDTTCIYESIKINEICEIPYLNDKKETKNILDKYLKEDITIKKSNSVTFKFLTYKKNHSINNEENKYLDLLTKILNEGIKTESRNGIVYSTFGEKMTFDLNKGFPLLTTKHMGYKTILRELLWFIKGSTSNKELNDKKVHIWDQNSSREFLDSRGLDYEEGDLGPVYGFQWRHFGAEYKDCNTDYSDQGIDQLKNIIDLIKTDPTSRRIILNSWNAADLDKMALPPCHVMCQFHVDTKNNKLDCQLYQRSGDMFLGVPFNIASYSFLTYIIAHLTGYNPGNLIHILGDAHIYESHIDAVNTQIKRIPYPFPELDIDPECTDIDNILEKYFTLYEYNFHPKINAKMIA
jgi:dihydrofolate reductase / thymidylate synthase